MVRDLIGKKASCILIGIEALLIIFWDCFWMMFLCSDMIMEWYYFALLLCGPRVALPDVRVV